MENQPKLGACVLGTKGVGFNGKGRDFPFRCRSQTASSEDHTPIASAPRVSIDQEDSQNAPLPSYQTRPDRHHGSPGSTKRQHTTAYANRGVKSSRQTKKLRVCITDLRGRSAQGNFSGRRIGDGDRLLRGLVVCRCCLPSDALVAWFVARLSIRSNQIEVVTYPLGEVGELIRSGEFNHAQAIAAFACAAGLDMGRIAPA